MKKIKILITDDHKLIRDGLRVMLETYNGKYIFSIDEASSGEAAVEKVKNKSYDVVLLDYQLPFMTGAEAARVIMQKKPGTKILALSNYSEYAYIDKMINDGKVKGYILKNITQDELIRAIETILSDRRYYSNEVALNLLSHDKSLSDTSDIKSLHAIRQILSEREIEILRFIADENTNETIADKLSISKRTVETHRHNIMVKLNVHNAVGLIKTALQMFSKTA
ncbi:MAG TPA: response regulator transcription factor [Bacteroidia bacterium]|jgi:DNA-binding NarL/FixJ family response regulator|nr:response regulator transcription factor [Bacteroidia bacterium]